MGLYYRLDHKKTTPQLIHSEDVRVVIDYYYNGKRTKDPKYPPCRIPLHPKSLCRHGQKRSRGKRSPRP